MLNPERQGALHDGCPSCGSKGKPVKPVTIESLVVEAARVRVGRADGFRFCAEPSCEVAYFHSETGTRIVRSEVRVRIGQKETEAPRAICYCFDHTVEAIAAEVAATGTSKVADQITEKCRQGLDRCEETNPQGSCCLGNVRRAIKEAHALRSGEPAAAVVAVGDVAPESCCVARVAPARTHARRQNTSLWAASGAIVSAILSAACSCWAVPCSPVEKPSAIGDSALLGSMSSGSRSKLPWRTRGFGGQPSGCPVSASSQRASSMSKLPLSSPDSASAAVLSVPMAGSPGRHRTLRRRSSNMRSKTTAVVALRSCPPNVQHQRRRAAPAAALMEWTPPAT